MPFFNLRMRGPYPLILEVIDANVRRAFPGNFALGIRDERGFHVLFIGRSDDDVNGALKLWVDRRPARYVDFKFCYALSPKDAFERECRNFHSCGGSHLVDNEHHPSRPTGVSWLCPVCDFYDGGPSMDTDHVPGQRVPPEVGRTTNY